MKLWKLLIQCMALILFSSTLCAQIKPTAMVLPINFVNLDKKGLQGSLNNHAKTVLSTYYDLKTEKEVEQAREAAIDKVSSEECTEEACVKIMGEFLDAEYTFSLEIIDTGEGWDLTVTRQDIDGVPSRKNELCVNCSLKKARKSLSEILLALRPGDVIQRGKAMLVLESTPKSQIFINGRDEGKTPLNRDVAANVPLEVELIAEGYKDYSEKFILKPGEILKKNVSLTLKRGNIRITSNPSGAKIYINGEPAIDSENKPMFTPSELRLVYGQHVLKFELEKYQVSTKRLKITKRNAGTKNIVLKPKPGRLVVRVPSDHKQARIMLEDKYLGSMDGSIAKNFELAANVRHSLHAEDDNFKSETKTVRIEPDGSEKIEFEDFYETRKKPTKKPFKYPKFDDINFSDWSGENRSAIFSYNLYYVTLMNKIELGYQLFSLGVNWKNFQIAFSSTGIGENSMQTTNDHEGIDSFFYSDGTNTREVISTDASFTRIMYAPNLDEFGSEYVKNRNPDNSWIWGVGLEFSNVTLTTKNDGDRSINAISPIIEGGYQWNWGEIGFKDPWGEIGSKKQGVYINLQMQLSFSASSNVSFWSYSSSVGYIF